MIQPGCGVMSFTSKLPIGVLLGERRGFVRNAWLAGLSWAIQCGPSPEA